MAGNDQTVDEDSIITFDGTHSLNSTEIIHYTWTFRDVTLQTLSGAQTQYTFSHPGSYIISLNITDSAGNFDTDSFTLNVRDITNPQAQSGNDQQVAVHTPVTFNASGSSDNVGIMSYIWDFGDGQSGADVAVSHTYSIPGNYTVTLTVIDAAGNSDTDALTIILEAQQELQAWMVIVIGGMILAIIAAVYLIKLKS